MKLAPFKMFHIPKGKTSRFGLDTLSDDGAKLWNKFYHAFLLKETDLTKSKFEKVHFLIILSVVSNFSASKSLCFKLNIDELLIS